MGEANDLGLLRAAAALAFHTAGVGVRLTWSTGSLLVAPSAAPTASCHPVEFREALGDSAELAHLLANRVPMPPEGDDQVAVSVVTLLPGVEDLGGGLFAFLEVPPYFAFTTALAPTEIFSVAQGSETMPEEVELRQDEPPSPGAVDFLQVRPLQDPLLGVTVVVVEPASPDAAFLAEEAIAVARATAAACFVTELSGPREEFL